MCRRIDITFTTYRELRRSINGKMRISTNSLGDGVYEGVVQEKDDWYVLSQGDRHAYLNHTSAQTLEEYKGEFAAVRGHLSAEFQETEEEEISTTGDFHINILEVGEVLGETDDGRIVSEFEDTTYVSDIDRYDPDPSETEYDLSEVEMPVWW